MKKFIEKLPLFMSIGIGILLVLFFIANTFASELTIDEVKKELNGDPYKITTWMAQNIKTRHEDIFYAQPPEYLFKHRKGDCEDWAILSRYFIGDKYETHLVVWRGTFREDSKYYKQMKNREISHCVLVIKINNNSYGIIDQDKYIPNGKSLVDIVKKNCDLRKVNPTKILIMDLYRFRRKIIEDIVMAYAIRKK